MAVKQEEVDKLIEEIQSQKDLEKRLKYIANSSTSKAVQINTEIVLHKLQEQYKTDAEKILDQIYSEDALKALQEIPTPHQKKINVVTQKLITQPQPVKQELDELDELDASQITQQQRKEYEQFDKQFWEKKQSAQTRTQTVKQEQHVRPQSAQTQKTTTQIRPGQEKLKVLMDKHNKSMQERMQFVKSVNKQTEQYVTFAEQCKQLQRQNTQQATKTKGCFVKCKETIANIKLKRPQSAQTRTNLKIGNIPNTLNNSGSSLSSLSGVKITQKQPIKRSATQQIQTGRSETGANLMY